MKWQSTAALAVVAVGIGAYIYFIESKANAPMADDKTVFVWNLSDAQAEKITKVVIKTGGKQATYIKEMPKPTPEPSPGTTPDPFATPAQPTWYLEGKLDKPLTYMWDTSWTDFKRMQTERLVDEDPKDETIFEFSSPSVEVKIYDEKQKELYDLIVGKETISGHGNYARRSAGKTVYLISNAKVENWKKLVSEPPFATPTPAPVATPTPIAIEPPATYSATASKSVATASKMVIAATKSAVATGSAPASPKKKP